jgi:hypothetical protein
VGVLGQSVRTQRLSARACTVPLWGENSDFRAYILNGTSHIALCFSKSFRFDSSFNRFDSIYYRASFIYVSRNYVPILSRDDDYKILYGLTVWWSSIFPVSYALILVRQLNFSLTFLNSTLHLTRITITGSRAIFFFVSHNCSSCRNCKHLHPRIYIMRIRE